MARRMPRRNVNSGAPSSYYAERARYYAARRNYQYARKRVRTYKNRVSKGFGPKEFRFYPDLPLAAGLLTGFTNLDQQIPGEVILVGASLPVTGKYGRSVRNFFGGVILGELVSKLTGKVINFPTTKKNASVTASIYA